MVSSSQHVICAHGSSCLYVIPKGKKYAELHPKKDEKKKAPKEEKKKESPKKQEKKPAKEEPKGDEPKPTKFVDPYADFPERWLCSLRYSIIIILLNTFHCHPQHNHYSLNDLLSILWSAVSGACHEWTIK